MENDSVQTPRTKVLFVVTKSNFGGAQRYVYDLATNLPSTRFEAVVACGPAPDGKPGYLVDKLTAAHIRTILIPTLSRDVSVTDMSALQQLRDMIRAEKPAVLHLNSSKAGGLGALAGKQEKVPRIIFTVHGLPYDENRPPFERMIIFVFTWITFLLCDTVICISSDTAQRVKKLRGVTRKVRLIFNATSAFTLLPKQEARARISTLSEHIPHDVPWIGTIAELTRNKGLIHAIDACALVREKTPDFALIIIGAGEQEALLKNRIERSGLTKHVFLLGFVSEARELLQAFDIFALPSVKEGLPYVLLEAAQAPLPVVASDIPGVRDIVENETSGLLVPPADVATLASTFTRLLQDTSLCGRLAYGLHESTKRTFSLEAMIENTVQLYR